MKRLRTLMHTILTRKFRVVYTPSPPVASEWSRRFFDLVYVHCGVEDEDGDDAEMLDDRAQQQRREESNRFLAIFNGDVQDTSYVTHHCGLFCDCIDPADSLQRAHAQFDTLVLKNLPELASLHRWTKYQRPTRKVCLALSVHGVFAEAFAVLY